LAKVLRVLARKLLAVELLAEPVMTGCDDRAESIVG
jgi:hypothetical protein